MLSDNTEKFIVIAICCIGLILRFQVAQSNPPNNSYDDHVEVINIYSQSLIAPSHSACWECYQPPLYYVICARIIKYFELFQTDWKIIQYFNLLLFVFNVSLISLLLVKSSLTSASKILLLTIYATLPRDIYTCAMIGNDYLLCSIVCAAAFVYSKLQVTQTAKNRNLQLSLLCTLCLLAISTKQHGLLIFAYPVTYAIQIALKKSRPNFKFFAALTCLICTWIATTAINMNKTGQFMVSNQNYYDYAENQPPGSIDSVEFATIKFRELWNHPHMTDATLTSFGTEIFARLLFDYEPKFTHDSCPNFMAIAPYTFIFGLIWTLLIANLVIHFLRNIILNGPGKFKVPIHTIISILFLMVPVLQTHRYPYFSSMKAMFLLPGIYTLFIALTQAKLPFLKFGKIKLLLAISTIIYYIYFFHTEVQCTTHCVTENLLHLWQLPSR